MPNIVMPTRSQLLKTYKSLIEDRKKNGGLKRLPAEPAGISPTPEFKNVGIKGMAGREDIFTKDMDLVVKNTKAGKTTWYEAGPIPMFEE
jgi:hypothetical protein